VKKPPVAGKTPWAPRSDAEAAPAAAGDRPWKGKPQGKPQGGDRPWAAKDARGKPAASRPYKDKGPR
jgi:ATP-dependent RNA helicase DeaD